MDTRLIPKVHKHNRVKDQRVKDKKHEAWIKTLPCAACGVYGVDPHHLLRDPRPFNLRRPKGPEHEGTYKSGDNWLIPLCRPHHSEIHAIDGKEMRLFSLWGISGYHIAIDLWEQTLRRRHNQ